MKKWFATYGLIFSRYLDYKGRSPRSELWNFIINTALIELVIYIFTEKSVFFAIFHIVAMIVLAALSVRRFHDIGYSGWFLLALFIPLVNLAAIFVLMFFKSVPEKNRYGSRPLQNE